MARGDWWHRLEDERIRCDLCPRFCKLREGEGGSCFIREARDGGVVLASYGRGRVFQLQRAPDVAGPYLPVSEIIPDLFFNDRAAVAPQSFYRLRQW